MGLLGRRGAFKNAPLSRKPDSQAPMPSTSVPRRYLFRRIIGAVGGIWDRSAS
jgi:hypothetical protein